MKATPIYYFIAIAMMIHLSLISCISSKNTIQSSHSNNQTQLVSSYPTNLTNYLKSFSCLEVIGNDVDGEVRVKGMGQLASTKGPLFVIDNIRMGNDLSNIAQILDIEQIAKLKVLRHPAELGIYGSDAVNGVIFIELLK